MTELDPHDLFMIHRRLPAPVANAMRAKDTCAFVAGGFVRAVVAREEPADIDMFVSSKLAADALVARILYEVPKDTKIKQHRTDNAITLFGLSLPVQIITRWTYENAHDLVASFDFTVCQAAVWWKPVVDNEQGMWGSTIGDRFYPDLAGKRLTYTRPARHEDAGGSLLRVLKYYQRGYRIPLRDLANVVARLVKGVDQAKVNVHDQIAAAEAFTGLLREVDPLIDPDHIMHESVGGKI